MKNKVLHRADERGHANHGWLNAKHSFSFANFYNPDKVHFGALRVLNDDEIAPGRGFGTHPHENMEIVTIPLEGILEHQDSMGNKAVIKHNEIQMMSAGTGIQHSEYNKLTDDYLKLLQIWVFPKLRNIKPRYDQMELNPADRKNKLQIVASPLDSDDAGIKLNQDAWFVLGTLDKGLESNYDIHLKTNGIYAFLIDGEVEINGQQLNKRDALGIWETEQLNIKSNQHSELLLIEVPMTF